MSDKANQGEVSFEVLHDRFEQSHRLVLIESAIAQMRPILYPDYEGPGTPNAPFVQQALNQALGSNQYVFDGVDRLGEKLDELLRIYQHGVNAPPPRALAFEIE
jgi:hypothetical protein